MNSRPFPIIYEPVLVEEAVLHVMRGHADERAFRNARNRLYVAPEGDVRERGFHEFHGRWFHRLRLEQPIEVALDELPILADACARCLVAPAPTHHDEGADLLVATEPSGTVERTVLIRVRPGAFGDAEALHRLLRAELLHVADMVDPAFGYQPILPVADGGPSYEHLLRDRYRALWDVSVAGRLLRRGWLGPDARAHAHRVFAAVFPMLGTATDAAFERYFDTEAPTHADLMAFAATPGSRGEARGLMPGGRCPLCRFPTYAPEPERLTDEVAAQVVADFPDWCADDGLCRQCADLYRARRLSVAAAAQLPGAATLLVHH
jgi:hypothetical protein